MLLASTDNEPGKEITYLKLFENYPVDGIILIGTVITAEAQEISERVESACGGGRTVYKIRQLHLS